MTASIAVKPAVPIAIACAALKPGGRCISHSALTRAFSAYPPHCTSPTRHPVKMT
jgi:hypothetical protein